MIFIWNFLSWIHAIRRAKLFYSVLDTDSKFVTGPHSQFSGEIASQEKVIKSGWIRKQGGKTQTWKNRWFILTLNSDNGIPTLLYFKEEPSDSNNTMTPEGEIPLFRCLISKADENYFKDGTIAIFTHFRHFFLEIGSPAEFKDWLDALIKMNEISFTNSQIVDFSCEFQDSEIRW